MTTHEAIGRLLVVCVITAAACRTPTLPQRNLDIFLYEDSVRARIVTDGVRVELHVQVENHDSKPIYFEQDQCGHALWRRTGSTWAVAWSHPCSGLRSTYSLELGPGESILIPIIATATTGATAWPAGTVEGEYRVLLWITDAPKNGYGISARPLATADRSTGVFTIHDAVAPTAQR